MATGIVLKPFTGLNPVDSIADAVNENKNDAMAG
jgi:hypothetical protein